ncbi:oxidoreductase [Rhodococcus pseudokoreensis]|uniref:Oxidoreductase n=1 Tax=Rhodococcus pseudokoreensis TaxID=2811421 RepID=A0A974ZZ24_9NOCA|nr:PDR/VanB family oxidoreductase [Rhodococcus pseudokoreensis]QSE95616.1 oxidoreductase [Rhodococcus pseudokoreensis]
MWGRRRHDRLVTTLDRLSLPYVRVLRHLHLPSPRRQASDDSLRVVVTDRRIEAVDENVVSFRLEPAGGGTVPPWYPGAHLDLLLPSGRLRQYSICGDPADRSHYRIAVRLIPDGGGGSREIHESLHVGTELTIRTPRNAFPLTLGGHNTRPQTVRFVAGGIGITPILPMIAAADRVGVDWSLLYCGRSRESLAFTDHLAAFGDRVRLRLDDEHDGPPTADDLLGTLPDDSSVYCCGPAPMIETLRTALGPRRTVGLHYERFAPPPIVDGTAFEIELATDGTVLTVAADRTALDAIRDVRRDATYSCRQGFCGSCRVTLLDGTPDHRGGALSERERADGQFLPCVSRADGGRLVVDL